MSTEPYPWHLDSTAFVHGIKTRKYRFWPNHQNREIAFVISIKTEELLFTPVRMSIVDVSSQNIALLRETLKIEI